MLCDKEGRNLRVKLIHDKNNNDRVMLGARAFEYI